MSYTPSSFEPVEETGWKPSSFEPVEETSDFTDGASFKSKALGATTKFSNIAGFFNTLFGAEKLANTRKQYEKASESAFKKANELTQKAKNTTDEAEKSRLLSEARSIMSQSGEMMGDINQEITNYRTAANITDEDMQRSNLDFAARRGGAFALEAGSMMVPGAATAAKTVGGRIAQAGVKGAISGGLSGAGTSLLDAETTGEFLSDTAVSSIMGGLTSMAFAGGSEAIEARRARKVGLEKNKWVKPTGELEITDSDAGKVIADNNGKKSFNNIKNKNITPQEQVDSFRKHGLAKNDLMLEATDKYGNKYSVGEKILDDGVDDIFNKKINPVLSKSNATITKKAVLSTLENNKVGSITPEVEDAAIKWVKENLDDTISVADAYKLKQQMMSGSFNVSGTPKISLNGQSRRSTGWAILGQIKENLPADESALLESALSDVTEKYAWKDVVFSAWKKYNDAALSGKFIPNKGRIAAKVAGLAGTGIIGSFNPVIGAAAAAPQIYGLAKEFATQPLQKFGQNIVEKSAGKAAPNILTSLIGKFSSQTQ